MTTMTDTCWADPLSRKERAELARHLGSACKRFWDAANTRSVIARTHRLTDAGNLGNALVMTSAEMSDLHLDVTERAEVPTT